MWRGKLFLSRRDLEHLSACRITLLGAAVFRGIVVSHLLLCYTPLVMGTSNSQSVQVTEKGLCFSVNHVATRTELLPSLPLQGVLSSVGRKPGQSEVQSRIIDDGGHSQHTSCFVRPSCSTGNAFIDAITTAFANHYPLLLKPDHFWLMVVQGVAIHTNKHAEELRSNWVAHEGKKTLTVQRDNFVLGAANDWAGVVAEFEKQIRANTVAGAVDMLTPSFSTTTFNETVAAQVAVMDVLQSYFDYRVKTKCGFREITLAGTKEDWQQLAARSVNLVKTKCLPELAKVWAPALESVYERILATFEGQVDVKFWQSFCKRGGKLGSGGCTWLNGWFNVFLPYGMKSPNHCCRPYDAKDRFVQTGLKEDWFGMDRKVPSDAQGLEMCEIPTGLSVAPVEWEYLGNSIPLQFKAGFIGVTQDPETRYISTEVGWMVVEAPTVKEQPVEEDLVSLLKEFASAWAAKVE